jgi:hypothetical protein
MATNNDDKSNITPVVVNSNVNLVRNDVCSLPRGGITGFEITNTKNNPVPDLSKLGVIASATGKAGARAPLPIDEKYGAAILRCQDIANAIEDANKNGLPVSEYNAGTPVNLKTNYGKIHGTDGVNRGGRGE